MPNTKQPDMRYNDSGYNDSTAYEALKNVQKEERRTCTKNGRPQGTQNTVGGRCRSKR